MKKFKALSFKEQLGIYAGLAFIIGAWLPFSGVSLFGISANVELTDWSMGMIGWIGAIVAVVCIFLKQPFIASVGFAVAALGVVWALLDTLGEEGIGLKIGSFICIAAAAVGVWATIDALISKIKESSASSSS